MINLLQPMLDMAAAHLESLPRDQQGALIGATAQQKTLEWFGMLAAGAHLYELSEPSHVVMAQHDEILSRHKDLLGSEWHMAYDPIAIADPANTIVLRTPSLNIDPTEIRGTEHQRIFIRIAETSADRFRFYQHHTSLGDDLRADLEFPNDTLFVVGGLIRNVKLGEKATAEIGLTAMAAFCSDKIFMAEQYTEAGSSPFAHLAADAVTPPSSSDYSPEAVKKREFLALYGDLTCVYQQIALLNAFTREQQG